MLADRKSLVSLKRAVGETRGSTTPTDRDRRQGRESSLRARRATVPRVERSFARVRMSRQMRENIVLWKVNIYLFINGNHPFGTTIHEL